MNTLIEVARSIWSFCLIWGQRSTQEAEAASSTLLRGELLDRLIGRHFPRAEDEIGNDWEYVQRVFPLMCEKDTNGALSILFGKSITELSDPERFLAGDFLTDYRNRTKPKERKRVIRNFLRGFFGDPAV